MNRPELSVRVVAQERGVPCQVAVTTAFRTGSPLVASTIVPEMTPRPPGCAKAVEHSSRSNPADAITSDFRRREPSKKFPQPEIARVRPTDLLPLSWPFPGR